MITLRRATPADWPQLRPVWREVVEAGETYVYPASTGDAEAAASWLPPAPAETWLAEDGGAVLGTSRLAANQPGRGDHVVNGSFMVAGAARGQGVGRALGEHFLDRARALGFRAVQFNAVVASNTGAVALWESLGLAVVGRVPGAFRHPSGADVDLLVMHRWL